MEYAESPGLTFLRLRSREQKIANALLKKKKNTGLLYGELTGLIGNKSTSKQIHFFRK